MQADDANIEPPGTTDGKTGWVKTVLKPHLSGGFCTNTVPLSAGLTYYPDPSYLVHEQCGDDVARQHSQTAKEADHVDDDVVLLLEVQMAALLRVEEGGVLHSTVFELLVPEVWREQRDHIRLRSEVYSSRCWRMNGLQSVNALTEMDVLGRHTFFCILHH